MWWIAGLGFRTHGNTEASTHSDALNLLFKPHPHVNSSGRQHKHGILSQILLHKPTGRAVYSTVTNGPHTMLFRIDWPGELRTHASMHLVATILWAPHDDRTCCPSAPSSYPAVKRGDELKPVKELMGNAGGLFGNSKTFQSSQGRSIRWLMHNDGVSTRQFIAKCGDTALAHLHPPEPGVLKPSLALFAPALSPSGSAASTRSAMPAQESQPPTHSVTAIALYDDLVLSAVLVIAHKDEWRMTQSPLLDEVTRTVLSGPDPSRVAHQSTVTLSTLPAYGSSSSLPSYVSSEA